jgi:hypothetical protein
MSQPSTVARAILKKASSSGEHYVKFSHAAAFWVIKHIPSPVFRRMKV